MLERSILIQHVIPIKRNDMSTTDNISKLNISTKVTKPTRLSVKQDDTRNLLHKSKYINPKLILTSSSCEFFQHSTC